MNAEMIALLTSPPFLIGCVPLVAPLGFYVLGEAALERERTRTVAMDEHIEVLESRIAALRKARQEEAEREREAFTLAVEPVSLSGAVAAAMRSPLEQAQDDALAWFEEFGQTLNAWAAAAGNIERDLFREQRDALSGLQERLKGTSSMEELKENHHATSEAVVSLLTVLISKTDRDLDPERRNAALQRALTKLVQTAGLSMTGAFGEEVDSGRHKLTGTVTASGPERRGTVAAVRTRGLMDGTGQVYARAEIAEFD